MDINWFMFCPALALLFFPADMVLPRRLRLRSYHNIDFGEYSRFRSLRAWWLPSIWLDPARALAGVWLLRHMWTIDPDLDGGWRHISFMINALIITAALCVQLRTNRGEEVLLAPLGFVAGIWLGLLSPIVAILAVVVGAGGILAFRSWSAYFICGGLYAGGVGMWIMGFSLYVPLAAGLGVLPWLLSAILQRKVIYPLRTDGATREAQIRGDMADALNAD